MTFPRPLGNHRRVKSTANADAHMSFCEEDKAVIDNDYNKSANQVNKTRILPSFNKNIAKNMDMKSLFFSN